MKCNLVDSYYKINLRPLISCHKKLSLNSRSDIKTYTKNTLGLLYLITANYIASYLLQNMKTSKNKKTLKIKKNSTRRNKRSSGIEKEICTRRPNEKYQIGTSGFMVSQNIWFKLDCLNCIEINSSFYRLPSKETIEKWRNFPENVGVTIKASKYITHIKRLHDVEEGWKILWNSIEPLGSKLQAILFQLPPSFTYNDENMKRIMKMHKYIPTHLNIVFEFRDISWFTKDVYDNFKKMGWCIAGTYIIKQTGSSWMGTMPAGLKLPPRTSSFNYLRIHGNRGYKGSLDSNQLKDIKQKMDKQGGDKSFVMFNNAFFDPRSNFCTVNKYKIRYAAVCNAVEYSSLL